MTHRLLSTVLVLLLFSLARPAAAQPASGDTTLAEALFRDARELMKKGTYDQACPKFEESYRLVPKLGTLLNLAACHDEQGKTGSAWGEYSKAVTEAKAAGEAERVKFARGKLTALEGRLTKVVVEVPDPVPALEVVIAGQTIRKAAWGTPIPLDPGEHELVVRAPGHVTVKQTVLVPAGPSTITEKIPALLPIPEGDGEGEPPPGDDGGGESDSPQAAIGWTVGAVGLVGLGLGAGFGVNTFVQNGDSDDHCDDANFCTQEGVDLRDSAMTSATISTIAFAVGAAALTAGIIVILTAPDTEASSPSDDAPAEAAPVEKARVWFGSQVRPGGVQLTTGVAW